MLVDFKSLGLIPSIPMLVFGFNLSIIESISIGLVGVKLKELGKFKSGRYTELGSVLGIEEARFGPIPVKYLLKAVAISDGVVYFLLNEVIRKVVFVIGLIQ